MTFAIINDNKVENIINAEGCVVSELSQGLGLPIVAAEGLPVFIGDEYNPNDGKFYRAGAEVSGIPPVEEQVRQAVDNYTLELINGGIL